MPKRRARSRDVSEELSLEDGPPPMKHKKPAEPKPTAKDRFNKDHQEEYESRDRSRDRIKQVEEHNNACPKLKDELDKRRDAIKSEVNTKEREAKSKTVKYSKPSKRPEQCPCRRCERLRNRRNKSRKKYEDGRDGKSRKRQQNERKTGVFLKKSESLVRVLHHHGKQINTASSAVTFARKEAGNNPANSLYIHDDPPPTSEKKTIDSLATLVNTDKLSKSESKHSQLSKSDSEHLSKNDMSYPSTSNHTISSYHSFKSQNHEPMVE